MSPESRSTARARSSGDKPSSPLIAPSSWSRSPSSRVSSTRTCTKNPSASMANAVVSMNATATRARSDQPKPRLPSGTGGPGQPVTETANGAKRVGIERSVDLLAEIADVDVDDVGRGLARVPPRVGQQLVTAQGLLGTAHHGLEQGELAGRQLDLDLASPHPTRRGVQAEVADLEEGRPRDRASSREGTHPGE